MPARLYNTRQLRLAAWEARRRRRRLSVWGAHWAANILGGRHNRGPSGAPLSRHAAERALLGRRYWWGGDEVNLSRLGPGTARLVEAVATLRLRRAASCGCGVRSSR